jgi:malate dehydrogenase
MFKNADVVVFIGGFPRKPGMERKDLLQMNKKIFVEQSKALSVANPNVKCVVVANPANTNAYILSYFATKVKKENITCLSRLDHNRAVSQIASQTKSRIENIEGVYVFGNHSLTQYPCIKHIKVSGKPISELVDEEWLKKTFIEKVQKRGGEILTARGNSSVFSAANAVVDHLRDWYLGSDKIVSMGVVSEGDYGIPKGLWTSLPVRCKNFTYEIVK